MKQFFFTKNSFNFLMFLAAVLGFETLRQFLVNYARPFIFSTYMSFGALAMVKTAYKQLESDEVPKVKLMMNEKMIFLREIIL